MFRRTLRILMPAAALLIALAWPAHVLAADHTVTDLGCEVSVLAASSGLNSDNADNLLERPATALAAPPELTRPAIPCIVLPAFLGRAPPFSL